MPGVTFQCLLASGAGGTQDASWNPADKASNVVLSNSDRTAGSSSSAFGLVRSRVGRSSGKYYYEIVSTSSGSTRTGIADGGASLATYLGNSARGAGVVYGANTVNGFTVGNGGTFLVNAGDILMFAVDGTNGLAWVGRNGSWELSGNPAAGTGQWISWTPPITVYPATSIYETSNSFTLNTKPAELSYSPPSGFSAWAVA